MNREQIFTSIRETMHTLFDLPPERVTLEAHVVNDLDLDSIDAIDLVLKLKDYTGRKIKPEEFKHVRTVGDVVSTVQSIVSAPAAA